MKQLQRTSGTMKEQKLQWRQLFDREISMAKSFPMQQIEPETMTAIERFVQRPHDRPPAHGNTGFRASRAPENIPQSHIGSLEAI
ncbi:hypothetical protein H6P81_017239 [Aristolochia fimbriata]|uniref:Uncharacterized protein n=1 Tax=Aristolochia fimbriata TaxID=158543 RepID=A0AAV7DZJ9_ARIFI|nr:hypothetical protein H6P81_017239 [Aristolochia fimbriata]